MTGRGIQTLIEAALILINEIYIWLSSPETQHKPKAKNDAKKS